MNESSKVTRIRFVIRSPWDQGWVESAGTAWFYVASIEDATLFESKREAELAVKPDDAKIVRVCVTTTYEFL
jgi:hypothetical protein